MTVLLATRVDDRGHFRYVVEAAPLLSIITEDQSAVVGALRHVGVKNPYRFISHAEQWGAVEVLEKADRSHRPP